MTTRSRTPQLLLFAALLLGIVTMHTLGHPSGHTSLHGPGHPSSTMSPHEHAAEPLLTTATATGTGMDMDPLSVCLAVLGGFTLALLLALAVGHPWTSGTAHPPLARLLRALWPNPPPPRTLLSRLSVLRI
ncbi:DUF6153 family protein [Streptomyces lutosisoli]|uniref:DUF6153 family protein n=1 Tax=Streptomyces lutosisoli TaxID=2665721 RepID=A0ABW2VK84_9ACTN